MSTQKKPTTKSTKSMSFLFNAVLWSFVAATATGVAAGTGVWALWLRTREAKASAANLAQYQARAALDISAANTRAEEAKKDTATARLEQEQMKARLAWRAVSPASLAAMAAPLGAANSVTLAYTANDPEAMAFAIQISKAFAAAGWNVNPESRTYAQALYFGVFVNGADESSNRVRAAFAAAGIEFSNEILPPPLIAYNVVGNPPPTLIMIGSKKPPF